MTKTLRDLQASGGIIVAISGTDTLREGQWLTSAVLVIDPASRTLMPLEKTFVLFVRKSDVAAACELWPEALISAPSNDWLVTAQ